jgi:hypothetical protein
VENRSEALRLAVRFEIYAQDHEPDGWPAIQTKELTNAAAELRRLHAENERLKIALEDILGSSPPLWECSERAADLLEEINARRNIWVTNNENN